MARRVAPEPTIVGNIVVDQITINHKGGSPAAILKKSVRGALDSSDHSFGAKMEFAPGVSCLLMAPGEIESKDDDGHTRKILVQRVSPYRYVIDLASEEEKEVIDPVTRATLKILEDKLAAGKLTPLTWDEFDSELSEVERDADRVLSERESKADKTGS